MTDYIMPLTYPGRDEQLDILTDQLSKAKQIICAILEADERGQGVRYEKAMDDAARFIDWEG